MVKIGDTVKIIEMVGEKNESEYNGRVGKVIYIDKYGMCFGDWEGCYPLNPKTDVYEIIESGDNSISEKECIRTLKDMITDLSDPDTTFGMSEGRKDACQMAIRHINAVRKIKTVIQEWNENHLIPDVAYLCEVERSLNEIEEG